MKKIILFCFLVFMLFTTMVSAKEYKMGNLPGSVDIPDNYHIFTRETDLKTDSFVKNKLDAKNQEKLKALFKNPMLKIYALSEDMTSFLSIIGFKDKVTQRVWDMNTMTDKEALAMDKNWSKYVKASFPNAKASLYQGKDMKYLAYNVKRQTFYATIKNGYMLVVQGGSNTNKYTPAQAEAVKNIVNTVAFETQAAPAPTDNGNNVKQKQALSIFQKLIGKRESRKGLAGLVGGLIVGVIFLVKKVKARNKEEN